MSIHSPVESVLNGDGYKETRSVSDRACWSFSRVDRRFRKSRTICELTSAT